jgi:hypothetical protein
MKDRDTTDVWTAVAIGAVIGIGAALIVRAQQEDDTHEIIKRLRPLRRQAARTTKRAGAEVGRRARQAGEAGEDVVRAGREILDELRSGARAAQGGEAECEGSAERGQARRPRDEPLRLTR